MSNNEITKASLLKPSKSDNIEDQTKPDPSKSKNSKLILQMLCSAASFIQIFLAVDANENRKITAETGLKENPFRLLLIPLGFLISWTLYTPLPKMLKFIWVPLLKKKGSRKEETQEERIKRIGENVSGFFYYLLSFTFGLLCANITGLLPKVYFGSFDLYSAQLNWGKQQPNFLFVLVHLLSYGHHLERLVDLLHSNRKKLFF